MREPGHPGAILVPFALIAGIIAILAVVTFQSVMPTPISIERVVRR